MTAGLWRFQPTDVEFLTALTSVSPPEVNNKLILGVRGIRAAGFLFFCRAKQPRRQEYCLVLELKEYLIITFILLKSDQLNNKSKS